MGDFLWREGVGVEPTQDLSQPRAGFEDQEAHRDQYPPEPTLIYAHLYRVLSIRHCRDIPELL